jgi:hypothetical protein
MSKFKEGNAGRPVGSLNKTTKELRETISRILNKELENIDEYKDSMTPKEWLDILIKLLPYRLTKAVPKHEPMESEPRIFNVNIIQPEDEQTA